MGRGHTIRFGKPDSGHAGIISITVRVRRAQWNAMKPGIQCVLSRRADVLLRVNLPEPSGPDEQAALVMGGKPSPFGMDVELLRRCAGSLTPAVRLRGLHAHLASGVGADGLLAAARRPR
jgi:diaminopimelate decarboxylase